MASDKITRMDLHGRWKSVDKYIKSVEKKAKRRFERVERAFKDVRKFSLVSIMERLSVLFTSYSKINEIGFFAESGYDKKLRSILDKYIHEKKRLTEEFKGKLNKFKAYSEMKAQMKKLRIETVRELYKDVIDPLVQSVPKCLMAIPDFKTESELMGFDMTAWRRKATSLSGTVRDKLKNPSDLRCLRAELLDIGEYLRQLGKNNSKLVKMASNEVSFSGGNADDVVIGAPEIKS